MATDHPVNGPAAAIRATAEAMAKAADAEAVILVEGISDQIAVETAARGRGRDLDADRVVVVPIGGAHAIRRFLPVFAHLRVAGLYDVREEEVIRRGLVAARVGSPQTRADIEDLGFFVCDRDLEDELVRTVGTETVEALFASHGDLGAFRSMRNQPAWRDRDTRAQMRRFLASGSRRKMRYARLLVELAVPRPLDALIGRESRAAPRPPGPVPPPPDGGRSG
jgi:hypothetical protein